MWKRPEDRAILFWPMRDYLILYKPGTNPLQIITIVRGSQDLPKIIGRRETLKNLLYV